MKKILVIGSINIDTTLYVDTFPKLGETILSKKLLVDLGGKGANQAVAIARSGEDVSFMTCVGKDYYNSEVSKVLDKEDIKLNFINVNSPTGIAIIVVDDNGDNKIVVEAGANTRLTPKVVEANIRLINNCDYICLQNEIPMTTNEYILKLAKQLGKVVIYNPAPYIKIDESLYQFIDYLTPNEKELNSLVIENLPLEDKCKVLLKKGIKNIIVTLGDKGAYYLNNKESGYLPALKVTAVDTVAAGDTFNGYFVAGLSKDLTMIDAIKLAIKASGMSVTKLGAIPSIPYLSELK